MSDNKNSDVLVYFLQEGQKNAIQAESSSELNRDDDLTKDFAAGRFFTTDNFTFSLTLADDEGDNALTPTEEGRSFARWRVLDGGADVKPPFQVEPDDISLSRMIDSSSPILLSHCLEFKPFDKAVIVKRARVGSTGLFASILRLEFTHVWIKSIDWEDNDAVKESIKFKFNAVDGKYVKRKPDGSPGSTLPFSWKSLQQVA